MSAAAAGLNHTQSAVSGQIPGLERQLGVPLMERHARPVRAEGTSALGSSGHRGAPGRLRRAISAQAATATRQVADWTTGRCSTAGGVMSTPSFTTWRDSPKLHPLSTGSCYHLPMAVRNRGLALIGLTISVPRHHSIRRSCTSPSPLWQSEPAPPRVSCSESSTLCRRLRRRDAPRGLRCRKHEQ
ncbi:helix-turn-helix domain-containing protein [Streptomyces sp. NPDC002671]